MSSANQLQELLIKYPEIELIELSCDMPTAEKAAEMCSLNLSSIAKTLIIKTEKEFLALVLRGSDRIDQKSLKDFLNCKRFRFATSEEVLKVTSYPAGGTPPIGLGMLRVVLDKKVLENEWVIAGGGACSKLIKISPQLIKELSHAQVADISEDKTDERLYRT